MMTVFIFAMGFLVTLLVLGAISLLAWGAVLDGRFEREERDRRLSLASAGDARSGTRPAA